MGSVKMGSPPSESTLARVMHNYFPGALPGNALHDVSRYELAQKFGLTPENTKFVLSICPDEINWGKQEMAPIMSSYWGKMCPIGGISGSPFAGKSGYKFFASQVPDDGNVLVLFGPHVGIAETGDAKTDIGAYFREGQKKCSSACGAVIGAYKWALGAEPGTEPWVKEHLSATDMQMDFIKAQIGPHAARISQDENPMAALAHQSYNMVCQHIERVVNTDLHKGYVVLIGGIQLNLPHPYEDHLMPFKFEVWKQGELVADLLSSLK